MTGSSAVAPTVSESLARWVAALSFDRLTAEVLARRGVPPTTGLARLALRL